MPRRAVAVDQGGCFETSWQTNHDALVFVVDVLHYRVSNAPESVPIIATRGLTNATLPYARQLAANGVGGALATDRGLRVGRHRTCGSRHL